MQADIPHSTRTYSQSNYDLVNGTWQNCPKGGLSLATAGSYILRLLIFLAFLATYDRIISNLRSRAWIGVPGTPDAEVAHSVEALPNANLVGKIYSEAEMSRRDLP